MAQLGKGKPTIKYFHMSYILPAFVDAADDKKLRRLTVGSRTLLGKSGASGTTAAHLHMEVHFPHRKATKTKAGAKTTIVIYAPIDPHLTMVRYWAFNAPYADTREYDTYTQHVTAGSLDKNSHGIDSDVGNSNEQLIGEPKRKICYHASAPVTWASRKPAWYVTRQGMDLFCYDDRPTGTKPNGPIQFKAYYTSLVDGKDLFDISRSQEAVVNVEFDWCRPSPESGLARCP